MKNGTYWAYNLPLQVWPIRENYDDENSKIIDARLVNYMPRKESICEIMLSDAIGIDETREEFFNKAADFLENLAKHMRIAAKDETKLIYYHDEKIETIEKELRK